MAPRKPISRAAIIARMKAVARRLGRRRLTRDEFCRESGISRKAIRRHFPRFWDLLRAAGLEDHPPNRPLDDDALLRALRDGFVAAGGIVGQWRFMKLGRQHVNTFKKRWGGWDRALAALRDWLLRHDPKFPYLDALDRHCAQAGATKAAPPPADRCYGELVRFRALEHAPTSESGVIFLFGMVAAELGFVLEALGTAFPDAEVKRRDGSGWRRMRVEFEHQSRNFRAHGHDPAGCDLIVCWEHNWPDCPVDILELRSALKTLTEAPVSGS
jgi:hypothetical protein